MGKLLLIPVCFAFFARAAEPVDLNAVHRIRAEAFENSKLMDTVFYLTDVHGPRMTNSDGFHRAADWAVDRLKGYGLKNVGKAKWGPFGKTWNYERFSAHLVKPGYSPLIGFPLAWTLGTNGPVKAAAMHAVIKDEKDFEKFKGKLRGKIVLIDEARATPVHLSAEGRRYAEKDLDDIEAADAAAPRPPTNVEETRRKNNARAKFLREEGVVAYFTPGTKGDGGTVFGSGTGYREGSEVSPTGVAIAVEQYNRMVRLLKEKQTVEVELDVAAKLDGSIADSYNVVAEIPGGAKADELVMIGAHFDSWHGGTGATDNAAGSAVMMEAMRILKALDLKPARTIRLALWSGEEQGLLGSKAYVKEHFADPATMIPTSKHGKFAAYFNLDNGTGKIRGVYLQGNDMMRPVFEEWFKPFRDYGAARISIRNTGGTDHLSFDAIGLPGFQFIQDPIEYSTRTHHSNMDVYDRLQENDLKISAAIVATFAYHAATRPEPLPRKPLPKAKPVVETKPAGPSGR